MKTLICYYSNTGNTLLVSKYFAKHLKNSSTEFFNVISDDVPNILNYDLIIFSTWTDYMNIPKKMIDFIKTLKGENKFSIALSTYGGVSGQTITNLQKLIKKQNFSFVGGFALHTPENTPILITKGHANENAPNENELNEFNLFIESINEFFNIYNSNGTFTKIKNYYGKGKYVPAFPRKSSKFYSKFFDSNFKVSKEKCIGCKICIDICPNKAISFDKLPSFDESKCYKCWACYNKCPTKAIYSNNYKEIGHYSRPNDILLKKLQ